MAEQVYKEVRVFEYPNAIVRVHIPELTEEERNRRMKKVHDAAAALLRSAYEAREAKKEEGKKHT